MIRIPVSTRPSQIIIQPVANGWVVIMPSNQGIDSIQDQLETIMPNLKGMIDDLRGEDNEIEKIIRKAERDIDHEEKQIAKPKLVADKSMLIFDTFDKVLAYLSENVTN